MRSIAKWQALTMASLAVVMSACVTGNGGPTTNEKAASVDDFIASELHRPGYVLVTRYTDHDPEPLARPWQRLKHYCESNVGTFEALAEGEPIRLNVQGADDWFGKFLCREGDTKRWAVHIQPVGALRYDGKTQSLLNLKVASVYVVNLKAEVLPLSNIRLAYCTDPKARATLAKAETFYREKLKVVPVIVDKSGFNRQEDVYRLVDIRTEMNAECPVSMSDVAFRATLRGKPNAQLSFTVEPREYPSIAYREEGVTLTPRVTIDSYRFGALHPKKRFRDKHLDVEIESITLDAVRYRVTNASDNYVELQAISSYVDAEIATTPVKVTLPPRSRTESLQATAPMNVLPILLTREEATRRSARIGLSVKYRIADNTASLYGEHTMSYAELVRLSE